MLVFWEIYLEITGTLTFLKRFSVFYDDAELVFSMGNDFFLLEN